MAGIDFGAFMNTFVGLQQKQNENEREDRDRAFATEVTKLKLQSQLQEDQRQERYLKLQETEGKQQGERFQLEQQRRQIENQVLATSAPFAEMQDEMNAADALATAQQKEQAFRNAGQTESADMLKSVIERAKVRQQQMGAQGKTGATTPAPQEGAPSGKAAGTEPPVVEPTQAGSSSPQGMAMDPPRQSENFYQRVRDSKSGDKFKSAEGIEYQVVDSPEQVQADQQQRLRWKQVFGKPGDPQYPNTAELVSRKEMEVEEGQFKAKAGQQRMQEIQGKQDEELMQTIDQQHQLNKSLKDAKAGSRIMATPQGVAVQGFSMDNLSRERAGLERMAEAGQLNRPVLEAYNQAFGQAFEKKLTESPELQNSVTRAGPTDFRIKFDADPSTSAMLNDARRMGETLEAHGLPPTVILRQSTPDELIQDFERGLPQGSQMRQQSGAEKLVRGSLGMERRPKPLDPETADQVNGRMAKLTAGIARSLYEAPPDQKEEAKANALNRLQSLKQNYFLGQGDYTGRKEAMGKFMESPIQGVSMPIPEVRERLKQLESILKPKATSKPSPSGARPSAGATPGVPGAAAINAAIMAGSIGAAENAKKVKSLLSSIGPSTKDKQKAAEASVGSFKSEFGAMTLVEKKGAQDGWKSKRQTWKNYGIKETTLKDINEALDLDRNDGF